MFIKRKLLGQSPSDVAIGTITASHFAPRPTAHHGVPATSTVLAYDSSQKILAVGTSDGRIKVFGGQGIEGLFFSNAKRGCKLLQFVPNCPRLVYLSVADDLEVWDLDMRKMVAAGKWNANKSITALHPVRNSGFIYLGYDTGEVGVVSSAEAGQHTTGSIKVLPYTVPIWPIKIGFGEDEDDEDEDESATPNAVVEILPHPLAEDSRLLIAYRCGLMGLWAVDLKTMVGVCGGTGASGEDSNTAGEAHEPYLSRGAQLTCVCWASDAGTLLAAGYSDGGLLIWEAPPLFVDPKGKGRLYVHGGLTREEPDHIAVFFLDDASFWRGSSNQCQRKELSWFGAVSDLELVTEAPGDPSVGVIVLTEGGLLRVHDEGTAKAEDTSSRGGTRGTRPPSRPTGASSSLSPQPSSPPAASTTWTSHRDKQAPPAGVGDRGTGAGDRGQQKPLHTLDSAAAELAEAVSKGGMAIAGGIAKGTSKAVKASKKATSRMTKGAKEMLGGHKDGKKKRGGAAGDDDDEVDISVLMSDSEDEGGADANAGDDDDDEEDFGDDNTKYASEKKYVSESKNVSEGKYASEGKYGGRGGRGDDRGQVPDRGDARLANRQKYLEEATQGPPLRTERSVGSGGGGYGSSSKDDGDEEDSSSAHGSRTPAEGGELAPMMLMPAFQEYETTVARLQPLYDRHVGIDGSKKYCALRLFQLRQAAAATRGPTLALPSGSKWPLQGGSLPVSVPDGPPSGTCVYLSGHRDGTVRLLDAMSLQLPLLVSAPPKGEKSAAMLSPVTAVTLCEVSGLLAVGHKGGELRVYQFSPKPMSVAQVRVVGDREDSAVQHAAAGFQLLVTAKGRCSTIRSLCIASLPGLVVAGDDRGMVWVLNLAKGSMIAASSPVLPCAVVDVTVSVSTDYDGGDGEGSVHQGDRDGGAADGGLGALPLVTHALSAECHMIVLEAFTGKICGGGTVQPKGITKPVGMFLLDGEGHKVGPPAAPLGASFVWATSFPADEEEDDDKSKGHRKSSSRHRSSGSSHNSSSDGHTGPEELAPATSSIACYVLLCTQDCLRLYSSRLVYKGDRTTIKKEHHTAEEPVLSCGVFSRVDHSGSALACLTLQARVQIRSLPDLGILLTVPVEPTLGWQFPFSRDTLGVSTIGNNGQLVVAGASGELNRLSLLKEENQLRLPQSLPKLFDHELAAATALAEEASAAAAIAAAQQAAIAAASQAVAAPAPAPVPAPTPAPTPAKEEKKKSGLFAAQGALFGHLKTATDKITSVATSVATATINQMATIATVGQSAPAIQAPKRLSTAQLAILFNGGAVTGGSAPTSAGSSRPSTASSSSAPASKSASTPPPPQSAEERERARKEEERAQLLNDARAKAAERAAAAAQRGRESAEAGAPSARSATNIKAAYGRSDAESVRNTMEQNRQKLIERGEKLQNLEQRTQQMEDDAQNFADTAKELAKAMENRKWWQV
eukprot:jgi/Mesvir1/20992/Mv08053-RA.1